MPPEIAVGQREFPLEMSEVGSGQADERGQDAESDPLVDVVIEVVDRMIGHARSSCSGVANEACQRRTPKAVS